jgi:cytochrome P450
MSGVGIPALDRERIRELFDLRKAGSYSGGDFSEDPYPVWDELRSSGPVHAGIVHELTGYQGSAMFQGLPYPELEHFSAFSWDACDEAFRNNTLFASSPIPIDGANDGIGHQSSMLSMGGEQHHRYRTLVQPSFVPAQAQWWIDKWIERTVHAVIDSFVGDGRAELRFLRVDTGTDHHGQLRRPGRPGARPARGPHPAGSRCRDLGADRRGTPRITDRRSHQRAVPGGTHRR